MLILGLYHFFLNSVNSSFQALPVVTAGIENRFVGGFGERHPRAAVPCASALPRSPLRFLGSIGPGEVSSCRTQQRHVSIIKQYTVY